MVGDADGGHDDDQRQARSGHDGQPLPLVTVELFAVAQQDRQAADQQQQHEEQRNRQQRDGAVLEGVDVEIDAADDEEDRHHEAEPDGLELAQEDRQVHLVVEMRDSHPHDRAGSEGAEQDVQAEMAGDQHHGGDQQDAQPHRQLRARVQPPLEDPPDPDVPGTVGEERDADGEHREDQQQHAGDAGVLLPQDQRDEHDRPELPDASDGQDVPAHRRRQHPAVVQDRQQRAERGRAQRHAGGELAVAMSGQDDDRADDRGERERHGPADAGQRQRPAFHRREVELVAGQEHQHGQAELGERRDDVVGLAPSRARWVR